MNKNSWDICFNHLRFDFNIKGIIIYFSGAMFTRVSIVGYPYVKTAAVNDNEVKSDRISY